MQLAVQLGLLVVKLDQHMLHGAIALGIPDDGLAAVAGAVVAVIVGVALLSFLDHGIVLRLDILVGNGDALGDVVVQLLIDIAVDGLLGQRVLGHAVLLQRGDGLGAGVLFGSVLGGEVALVGGHVALEGLRSLGLQLGAGLVVHLAQAQLGGLGVDHGALDQRFQDVLLDAVGVIVDGQAVLGVSAGCGLVLLHGVVAPDDAVLAKFGHDLLFIIGLVLRHQGFQLGHAGVGLVQPRLEIAVGLRLRQRHRAQRHQHGQGHAQQFLHFHCLCLHFIFRAVAEHRNAL